MTDWARRNSVVVAILVAGVLVTGAVVYAATRLGGSSSKNEATVGEATETGALSMDEFILRADAACARIGRQVGALPDVATFEGISRQANQVAEYYREGVAQVRSLTPPAEQEQLVDEWLDLLEESIGALELQASAAFSHDLEAFQAAGRDGTEASSMALTKARTLRLDACANTAATNEL